MFLQDGKQPRSIISCHNETSLRSSSWEEVQNLVARKAYRSWIRTSYHWSVVCAMFAISCSNWKQWKRSAKLHEIMCWYHSCGSFGSLEIFLISIVKAGSIEIMMFIAGFQIFRTRRNCCIHHQIVIAV